jgi:hypothetical protein
VFLSNQGRAPLFCLGCRRQSTTGQATNVKSLVAGLIAVGAPVYFIFFAGLLWFPEWVKAVAVVVAFTVLLGARAYFMERLADALVDY